MLFSEFLSKEQTQKINNLKTPRKDKADKKKQKEKKENLSPRDWEEIMGTRRDRFRRVNGAVRRQ